MIRDNFQNQFKKFDLNDLTPFRPLMNGTGGITHTDIKRLRQGKVGAQFWAVFESCDSLAKDAPRLHLEQLDVIKRFIRKFPNHFEYVTTSDGLLL
jgi:membrane dipeptidase